MQVQPQSGAWLRVGRVGCKGAHAEARGVRGMRAWRSVGRVVGVVCAPGTACPVLVGCGSPLTPHIYQLFGRAAHTHTHTHTRARARPPPPTRTRAQVDVLTTSGVKFSAFDILQDNDVRQGIKAFSNWPTFPQVCGGVWVRGVCHVCACGCVRVRGSCGCFSLPLPLPLPLLVPLPCSCF